MLSRTLSAALFGIEATIVQVEVHASPGLPAVNTVGLPDGAVRESRERVRSAILNSGLNYPQRRLTVNLAPADLRKVGSSLDLPMAVAIAALEEGVLETPIQHETILLGELALDGGVRPVTGALSVALAARARGLHRIVLPCANAAEASVVTGIDVMPVSSLTEAIAVLNGSASSKPAPAPPTGGVRDEDRSSAGAAPGDMADVRGQVVARRALEVAAGGGHNLLFVGPPGSGKTMLARRLPTLLPSLSLEESVLVTRVHSASGRPGEGGLIMRRPFRSPHHTATAVALAGGSGGPAGVRPGEASLAHLGVLFLDELPEFSRHVLDALRQPLEDGFVTISRAARTARFPAAFTLVASMNPCQCGYRGHPTRECTCTPPMVARYLARVSGPLLDRIDLQVVVPPVTYSEMSTLHPAESSATIATRVLATRRMQRQRWGAAQHLNARIPAGRLRSSCPLDAAGQRLMEHAVTRLGLSARAHDRVLRVARTIADMEGADAIKTVHLAEAIQYRSLDRPV